MSPKDPLREYQEKRDFRRTPEPRGARKKSRAPIFVIQKHDASRLHYDFRLEVNGVLKSWAVPKGPSRNPTDKRLAMQTEDHPLGYAVFEGVIPKGQYGGGTVMVWDAGTYRNLKKANGAEVPLEEGLEKGHITFWLEGTKLKGGYALTRMGRDKSWLLVKMNDEHATAADDPLVRQPDSALSGKSLEEITGQER